MSVCGSMACATAVSVTEPYSCDPFHTDPQRTTEYQEMWEGDLRRRENANPPLTTAVRAWIRETDRVCRANNALRSGS